MVDWISISISIVSSAIAIISLIIAWRMFRYMLNPFLVIEYKENKIIITNIGQGIALNLLFKLTLFNDEVKRLLPTYPYLKPDEKTSIDLSKCIVKFGKSKDPVTVKIEKIAIGDIEKIELFCENGFHRDIRYFFALSHLDTDEGKKTAFIPMKKKVYKKNKYIRTTVEFIE